MKRQSRRTLCAAGLITAALASGAFAQQQEEKLGTLSFPTSCDPKVQAEFERGVAMIHSYWFLIARRVFEGVLQQDPNCAIAYWGIAMDQLGNSLVGPPPRAQADASWRQGRIEAGCAAVESLHARLTGPRTRFHERAAVEDAATGALAGAKADRWVGFEVTETFDLPRGPRLWLMWRDPR